MPTSFECSESLETLPEGMTSIPPALQNKLKYDPEKKILVLTGCLTEAERDQLRAFSKDVEFWKVVERLYEKSAGPPESLRWKEGDDSKFVTEELTAMKQVIHRSLAGWFILLGFGSIILIISLWPSGIEMQTPTDRRLDSLAQLIARLSQPVNDSTTTDSMSPATAMRKHDSTLYVQAIPGDSDFPGAEQRFLMLALCAGILGGSAGGLASLLDFRGNRRLFSSWTLWYFAQPIVAGMMAVIFYVCIRAGFFSSSTTLQNVNVFGVVAFCAMVGLFTDDATSKLSQVFKTLFASTDSEARDGQLVASDEQKEGKDC